MQADVDETYATQISPGLAAVLQLKGETTKLDGQVSFVAAQVDAATGGDAVKVAFDVPVVAPVGLTVTANIIVDRQEAAIAVPRAAVISDAQGTVVFVAVAGHALRRDVTVVDWPSARVEVTGRSCHGHRAMTALLAVDNLVKTFGAGEAETKV